MGHKWYHPEFLDDDKPLSTSNPGEADNEEFQLEDAAPVTEQEERDAGVYETPALEEGDFSLDDIDAPPVEKIIEDSGEDFGLDNITNPHRDYTLTNVRNAIKKGSAVQLVQPLLGLLADHPNFTRVIKGGQTIFKVGGEIIDIPNKLITATEKHIKEQAIAILKKGARGLDDDAKRLLLKYKDEIVGLKKIFVKGKKVRGIWKLISGGITAIQSPAFLKVLAVKYGSKYGAKAVKYTAKYLPRIAKIGTKSLVPILGAGWLGYDVYKKTGSIWKAIAAGISGIGLDILTTFMTGGSLGAGTIPAILTDIAGTIAIEDIATGENTLKAIMEDYEANKEEYHAYFNDLLGLDTGIKRPSIDRAQISAIKDIKRRLDILPEGDPGRKDLERQLAELVGEEYDQKVLPDSTVEDTGEEFDLDDSLEDGQQEYTSEEISWEPPLPVASAGQNLLTGGDGASEPLTDQEIFDEASRDSIEEPDVTGKEIIDSLAKGETAELEDEEQVWEVIKEFYSREHHTAPGATHLQLKGASVIIGIDERKIKVPRYVFRKYVDDMADTASEYLKQLDLNDLSVDQRRYVVRLQHYILNAKGTDNLLKDRAGRMLHKIVTEAPNDVHKLLNALVEGKKYISRDLLKALEKTALTKSRRFAIRTALKNALYTMVPIVGAGLGAYEIYNHPKGGFFKAIGGGLSLAAADAIQTKLTMLGASPIESIGLGIIMDAYIMDKFTNNNIGGLEDLLFDMYEDPEPYIKMANEVLEEWKHEEHPETFANEKRMKAIRDTYSKMPKKELQDVWQDIDNKLNASGDKKERAKLQMIREVIGNIIIEPNRRTRKSGETRTPEEQKNVIKTYKENQGGA